MRNTLLSLFASALLTAPFAASAQPQQITPSPGNPNSYETIVNYSDLDLGRSAGADAAIARVQRAARMVCGGVPHPAELELRARFDRCVATSVRTAVDKIDAPLVSARYGDPSRLAVIAAN